jgi:hypothetical protein
VKSLRGRTGRHGSKPLGPLDVELEVVDGGAVRIDHLCPGAGMHRLLGVEPTGRELAVIGAGGEVAIVVRCDLCPWERRLLLRAPAPVEGR